MKRLLAILLSLVLCFSFAACANSANTEKDTENDANSTSDLAYIQDKGKLVVGVTDFAPMDYQEKDSDEWIGFDAEMAKAFAKSIGVDIEIIEIEWENKLAELEGKSIDCVWNGMTLVPEVTSAMNCSNAYCNNQQIIIVKADVADKYQTKEACKNLTFAVEAGSAGAEAAAEAGFNVIEVKDQATALTEVKGGTADAAIIDSLMAAAMVGEGTDYADLTYTVGLTNEEYGVGFRKDSDLTETLNTFFKSAYADGTMQRIAEKYGVQAALIEQK